MKKDDYIKLRGREKISELCNWDLADIKSHLLRETDLPNDGRASREMSKFKELFNSSTKEYREDYRIEEIKRKLEE